MAGAPVIRVHASARRDVRVVLFARSVRAFVDGIAFVVLPVHLRDLGFSATGIGTIVGASLLGSALLTLSAGRASQKWTPPTLLRAASILMLLTGIAFGLSTSFAVVLVIAFVTTMNASAGDVSPFLPLEQSLLGGAVPDAGRTALFARYALLGALVGAFGALCAGLPGAIARALGSTERVGHRAAFVIYGAAGVILWMAYSRLSAGDGSRSATAMPLGPESRRRVLRLAALFSLDSFGGGFATQAIFALWVFDRFDLSVQTLGSVFFATGVVAAFSSLVSVRIAARIGLVRTMVFTHVPASILLVLVALSPNAWIAMGLFIVRGLLSQMDVPARTSYVMAVVPAAERPAASSITNVPRSLASVLPPLAAGWMLDQSSFGWPLIVCAACKITYDLLLLAMFRDVRPPEETADVG